VRSPMLSSSQQIWGRKSKSWCHKIEINNSYLNSGVDPFYLKSWANLWFHCQKWYERKQ
jgi:hypothetical protein